MTFLLPHSMADSTVTFLPQVQNALLNTCKPSMSSNYNSKWKHFSILAALHSLGPLTLPLWGMSYLM